MGLKIIILGLVYRTKTFLAIRSPRGMHQRFATSQERYLNFLKTRMIKDAEIYKMDKSMFCYNPSFFQTGRERAVATVKNRLRKYGFLKKKEFLNSSAAPVIQQILIKEFPCT